MKIEEQEIPYDWVEITLDDLTGLSDTTKVGVTWFETEDDFKTDSILIKSFKESTTKRVLETWLTGDDDFLLRTITAIYLV